MTTTPPVRVERRAGQRFPYLLPLTLAPCGSSVEGVGFTQDLSSRGVFFFTDTPLEEGSEIEVTLQMPSEITLGEGMRVRCRGRILRVVKPVSSMQDSTGCSAGDTKIGVAVRLEGYEYLSDPQEAVSNFPRVSPLHEHEHDGSRDADRPLAQVSARPVLG